MLPDYNPNSSLPLCLIVDIDGTLAVNNNGRYIYAEETYSDDVRLFVRDTIEALGQSDRICKIFIFSGREGKPKQIANTVWWLHDKCNFSPKVKEKIELHLRAEKDLRCDAEVKMDMYMNNVHGKYEVFAVFDDRAKVVRNCWKRIGVPVFRCGVIDDDEF